MIGPLLPSFDAARFYIAGELHSLGWPRVRHLKVLCIPGERRSLCVSLEAEGGARVSALFEMPIDIHFSDTSAIALLRSGFLSSLGKSRARATP